MESQAVVAPALPCWLGTIVEHVSLVAPATAAVVFGPRQDELEVRLRVDMPLNRLGKAGPTSSTVELGIGDEERQRARGAEKRTRALLIVERMRKGALGGLLEQDGVLLGRKQLTPLGMWPCQLTNWFGVWAGHGILRRNRDHGDRRISTSRPRHS